MVTFIRRSLVRHSWTVQVDLECFDEDSTNTRQDIHAGTAAAHPSINGVGFCKPHPLIRPLK